MKAKYKLEKNVLKLCQMFLEEKTPFEKQKEFYSQMRMLDEKYRIKFNQLQQEHLLQKKLLIERFNNSQ
jgi:hypothetical protein